MSDTATEKRLLVPIDVEAFAVGASAPDDEWVDLKPDFRNIYENRFLGVELESEPCRHTVKNLYSTPGIHLHFALPDGLAHGIMEEGDEVPTFPAVPNRWLVVRTMKQLDGDGTERRRKAWIIESDTITDDENGALWPRLKDTPDPDTPGDYYVRTGRRFELSEWPGETGARSVDITPMGYGDPGFSAYYPACRGILGFFDDTLRDEKDVSLTYFVTGWYADPKDDPLHAVMKTPRVSKIVSFFNERKWTYPGLDELSDTGDRRPLKERVPTRLLCHCTVKNIRWVDSRHVYESTVPRNVHHTIAVGSTSAEALTLLLTKQGLLDERHADLLEAFQFDVLRHVEQPGGREILDQKLHKRGFTPLIHGTRWEVVHSEDKTDEEEANPGREPPIPGDIQQLLFQLNRRQETVDGLRRQRAKAQSDRYAAWYRRILSRHDQRKTAELRALEETLDRRIQRLNAEISRLVHDRYRWPTGEAMNRLKEAMKHYLPDRKLVSQTGARFWRPNDPVVVIEGPATKRGRRHGEDGRYRKDGKLFCRLSGQELGEVRISGEAPAVDDVALDASVIDTLCRPLMIDSSADIPLGTEALLRESFLLALDSDETRSLAQAIEARTSIRTNTEDIASGLRRLLSKNRLAAADPDSEDPIESFETVAGRHLSFSGVFPSPAALHRWKRNPWLPLYLQWRVCFESDRGGGAGKGATYTGTTLLTPSAAETLGARILQYALHLEDNSPEDNSPEVRKPAIDAIHDFRKQIEAMNILGQSLDGWTEQLLARKSHLELRPLEPGSDTSGPLPSPVFQSVSDIEWLAPLVDTPLFPLRHGRLKLEKLWLIDAFGQVLKLEKEQDAPVGCPLARHKSTGEQAWVELPPRLSEPARLTMQWSDFSPEKSDGAGDDSGASPLICGWVLPNFLDDGLMIYDADGYALGALQSVRSKSWSRRNGEARGKSRGFHWIDMPGGDNALFGENRTVRSDPLGSDADPHLRGFVNGLLALGERSGIVFDRLLDTMSNALSSSGDPGGGASNPNLALLIGTPLALMRASIHLELLGQRSHVPNSPQSGETDTTGFELALGALRKWNDTWLGEDGLVGFFLNRDFSRFYPASGLESSPDRHTPSDGYNFFGYKPTISSAHPVALTLLLDPSRGVSVGSDILPTKRFSVPFGGLGEEMESKQVIFFTGPVLGPSSKVQMPVPSDIYGQWSWTHHPKVNTFQEDALASHQNAADQGFETLRISDGWLKLVTAPTAIEQFKVKGREGIQSSPTSKTEEEAPIKQFIVPPEAPILLVWTVVGADVIRLEKGDELLFETNRRPLPTQFLVDDVEKRAPFTLTVWDRETKQKENTETNIDKHGIKRKIEIIIKAP